MVARVEAAGKALPATLDQTVAVAEEATAEMAGIRLTTKTVEPAGEASTETAMEAGAFLLTSPRGDAFKALLKEVKLTRKASVLRKEGYLWVADLEEADDEDLSASPIGLKKPEIKRLRKEINRMRLDG